jgi:hypothetical protein
LKVPLEYPLEGNSIGKITDDYFSALFKKTDPEKGNITKIGLEILSAIFFIICVMLI